MKYLLLLLILLTINSCYYTAQSYNNGKLLDPGFSKFTFGAGRAIQKVKTAAYNYGYYDDSTTSEISTSYETKLWHSIALNYQLGVLDKYPFGGGLEIGIQLEGSYYKSYSGFRSDILPAIDFNVRLGCKDFASDKFLYQHNIEAGWTTGMFVDNGAFLGYAGGWEFPNVIPYFGVRAILMPTNILNSNFENDQFFSYHNQKFNIRTTIGISIKLPKLKVLPDIITPELSVTGPNGYYTQKFSPNFHIGFSWSNGW